MGVGNGDKRKDQRIYLEVEVHRIPIVQHFFIMELGGTNLVLGMDWLASLGNVKANFKNLILSWGDKGEKKSMRGRGSFTMQISSLLEGNGESSYQSRRRICVVLSSQYALKFKGKRPSQPCIGSVSAVGESTNL